MPYTKIKREFYFARKIRKILIPGRIPRYNSGRFPVLYQISHFAFAHFQLVQLWQLLPLPIRNLQHFEQVVPLSSVLHLNLAF